MTLDIKESEERDSKMTRKIEHGNTYAQMMNNLEKRLDAKADLMLRKVDELLSSSNQENSSSPRETCRGSSEVENKFLA